MGRSNSQRGGYGGHRGGGRGWGNKGGRGKGNAGYGGGGGHSWDGQWQQPQHYQQAPLAPINLTGASLGLGLSPAQPAQMQQMALASLQAPLQSTLVPQTHDPSQEGLAQLGLAIQQGHGQGGISLVVSDQTAMMLLQQGVTQAASQAQAAQQAQADNLATILDTRFGLSTLMKGAGSQSKSPAKATSKEPTMVVEQMPTPKKKGKAPKDITPVKKQNKTSKARDKSSKGSKGGKESKKKSSSKKQLQKEAENDEEEDDEEVDCEAPSQDDTDTDSSVISKSKKVRAKAQAKLRESLARIAELEAENKAYKDQAASGHALETILDSRASSDQRILEGYLSEDNVVARSTRSRTRAGQPDRGTPLKDILAEAKAQVKVGPEAYEACQIVAKAAVQRARKTMFQELAGEQEQQRIQAGQAGRAPKTRGSNPPKGVLNTHKRKGQNKGTDTSPLRSVTKEGDSRKKHKETPPSGQPPPNKSAAQADIRSLDEEFEEDEEALEDETHILTALMQDPIVGSSGASTFGSRLGPAQSEEAGPSSAAVDPTITALRPCFTQVPRTPKVREGTRSRSPRGEDHNQEGQPCLSFLDDGYLSPALGHLMLTDRDKLNCMLLGITECLDHCSNMMVELHELPTREQQTLEGETSKEFLRGSYLKVSQEDRETFQTSLMEGVASRFGIKPTRRMTLKHWLCIVMRILQANKVDIQLCDYLMVAKDPHYMVAVGSSLYDQLKNSVVPLRAGLTMGVPVQPDPLTVMEDEVQSWQEMLAAATKKRDEAKLLAGGSDGQ